MYQLTLNILIFTYNYDVIQGIRQDKRLERAHDLEAILKKFFKVTLGLTVVNFEEVTKSRTKSLLTYLKRF